jgi:hypothetical protein
MASRKPHLLHTGRRTEVQTFVMIQLLPIFVGLDTLVDCL